MALAILATVLIIWVAATKVKRRMTRKAGRSSMTVEGFMRQLEEQVARADELVNSGEYEEPRHTYENVTEALRALRESQLSLASCDGRKSHSCCTA